MVGAVTEDAESVLIVDDEWLVHPCVMDDQQTGSASDDDLIARVCRAAGMVSVQARYTFDEAVRLMREHGQFAGVSL